MPSLYIETFGCQMNEADSQYIARRAISAGYHIAQAPEEANVVVLNTCTVRDNAERRAYGRMNHFKSLKDADPGLRLVVMGCLAEQDRDRMQDVAPHVDAVFGTKELALLGDQLAAWRPDFDGVDFSDDRALLMPLGGHADALTDAFSHLRAFVTVQRGCSYFCTFCIVPHVRGRFDHRSSEAIVEEARQAVERGAREITLVGQTVNAWSDPVGGATFGDLCKRVAALRGLESLSFISPHPKDFSERTIADLAGIPQLSRRIHLPLQSACDRILRRMNRKYTLAQFHEKVELIRQYMPHCAITTDIIVGFPGETETDFDETLAYVRSNVFANAFTFIYSIRRDTPAARWDQVPREAAVARFARLVDAQNLSTRAYHERKIRKTVRTLICGTSKKDSSRLAARALDNVTVIAPKPTDYGDGDVAPHEYAQTPWLDVEIESAHVWGCVGNIVGRAAHVDGTAEPVARPVLDLVRL